MVASLLSRQNLLQAAPTYLIVTLIPPTALLLMISSGLMGIVPHVSVSVVRQLLWSPTGFLRQQPLLPEPSGAGQLSSS